MSRALGEKALLQLIKRCLLEGSSVEIEGFGSFRLDAGERVVFETNNRIRVFLAYAAEDRAQARRLYRGLKRAGFAPWMDQEKLLPGQNWPRAIEHAIETADFFVGCFSCRSAVKRGYFQSELRYALDIARHVPLDDVFFVPVRLSDCDVPRLIAGKTQYVDLFPDWDRGLEKLVTVMWRQALRRKRDLKRAS